MKYALYVILAIFCLMSVSAQVGVDAGVEAQMKTTTQAGVGANAGAQAEAKAEVKAGTQAETKTQAQERMQANATGQERAQAGGILGLNTALEVVTNAEARSRLQANIEKIEAQLSTDAQAEVESYDEETGEVTVRAQERVKYFGFINGKANVRYSVNAQGAVETHAPWYRFLYAKAEGSTQAQA